MRLIEIGGTIVELLVRAAVENIRRVVIGVVQRFGPRVRNAVLKATGVTAIDLRLQAVVIRGAAIHDGVDVAKSTIGA